jgi:hypothetical protein
MMRWLFACALFVLAGHADAASVLRSTISGGNPPYAHIGAPWPFLNLMSAANYDKAGTVSTADSTCSFASTYRVDGAPFAALKPNISGTLTQFPAQVGCTSLGNRFNFQVNVPAAGTCSVIMWTAKNNNNGTWGVLLDNTQVATVSTINTLSWDTFVATKSPTFAVGSAGTHTISFIVTANDPVSGFGPGDLLAFQGFCSATSADGSVSIPPYGKGLVTAEGTWAWGAAAGSGEYFLTLNGAQSAQSGNAATVNNGGLLYRNTAASGWFVRSGGTWTASSGQPLLSFVQSSANLSLGAPAGTLVGSILLNTNGAPFTGGAFAFASGGNPGNFFTISGNNVLVGAAGLPNAVNFLNVALTEGAATSTSIAVARNGGSIVYASTLTGTDATDPNAHLDYIGYVPAGSPDNAVADCDKQWWLDGTGGCVGSGPVTLTNPAILTEALPANGSYEARLYYNGSLQILARQAFSVP